MADAQDRTLPASARKIQKARQDGQVARSRDLSNFAVIAAGGALLVVAAPWLTRWLQRLLSEALRFDARAIESPAAMTDRLGTMALDFSLVVLPLGFAMALIAIGANIASGGWNWTFKPLAPKFEKLSPSAGFGRIFSKHNLGEILKAALLALLLGSIGALYLRNELPNFADAAAMPLPAAFAHSVDALVGGGTLLVLALAAFAAIDVPLQRKLLLDRLKMSHQEVKQEHKEIEGNEQVKAKIRVRMREMAKRRMLAAVPKADIVVMNPTHYAVALRYDESTMTAPRVVAKGADLLALRIRDIARDSKVPVLQAPPLARALYAHAEVDAEVPAALFAAVAQVLAYVYQLRAAFAGRGAMPGELPPVEVPPQMDPHHGKAAHREAAAGA